MKNLPINEWQHKENTIARPLSKIEDLKNPRVIRRSPVTGVAQLDVPKPTKAVLKRWKPLLDICLVAISKNVRLDNVGIKEKVSVTFPNKKRPDGWPIGRLVSREGKQETVDYNAELIILYLWERKISEYTPSQWYAMLQPVNSMLRNIEKPFDIDQYMLHNDVYQMIDDNEKEN